MTEKINCPFCGNLIDVDAIRCANCDSLFKEPELPNIKFKEFGVFLAIDVVTFGIFQALWFLINKRALNKLSGSKDSLKFTFLVALLVIFSISFYIFPYKSDILPSLLGIIIWLTYIALSYRVLRIIQKYTRETYNVDIEFNPYYLWVFNVLYLIHFIDTYEDRVLHLHEYFNWKSPIIFIIFLILPVFIILLICTISSSMNEFFSFIDYSNILPFVH